MNKPGIVQLQHWMKDVITCQGDMPYKLQNAAQLHHLQAQDVVADTHNASIYNRINVYTSGYVMRLLECLQADFPVLQKFLGDEVFDKFARASLMWSPSKSYTLYGLGDTFIQFLVATKPADVAMADEQSAFFDLPIEIAKMERARHEAMRAKGLENVAAADAVVFQEDVIFGTLNYEVMVPDCLQLQELKFPMKVLIGRISGNQEYEIPEPRKTWLATSRMNYRITMEELDEWQYVFLLSCRKFRVFSTAIDKTAAITGMPKPAVMANLCFFLPWFQERGFVYLTPVIPTN